MNNSISYPKKVFGIKKRSIFADTTRIEWSNMVDVAQLVEPWIVVPVVAGSSPVVHPSLER